MLLLVRGPFASNPFRYFFAPKRLFLLIFTTDTIVTPTVPLVPADPLNSLTLVGAFSFSLSTYKML